jgi:hypothetical protein
MQYNLIPSRLLRMPPKVDISLKRNDSIFDFTIVRYQAMARLLLALPLPLLPHDLQFE